MKTTDNKKRRYPVGGRKSNGKWLPSDSGSFSFTQQQKNSLSTAWRVAATNTAKRKQVDGYIELVEKDIRLQNQINAACMTTITKEQKKYQLEKVTTTAKAFLTSLEKLSTESFSNLHGVFRDRLYFEDSPCDALLKNALRDALAIDDKYFGLMESEVFIRHLIETLANCADETVNSFSKISKPETKSLVWRIAKTYEQYFNKLPSSGERTNFRVFCRELGDILGVSIGEDLLKEVLSDF